MVGFLSDDGGIADLQIFLPGGLDGHLVGGLEANIAGIRLGRLGGGAEGWPAAVDCSRHGGGDTSLVWFVKEM